jgi:hypothetical protein
LKYENVQKRIEKVGKVGIIWILAEMWLVSEKEAYLNKVNAISE